jgi:PleD family two-component response regulator
MVAKRLSQVGGEGQAFRCGGEEFAIVFRNTSAKEAFDHLDDMRQIIEKSTFHMRGSDRRAEAKAERTADASAEKSSNRRAGELDRRKSKKKKAVIGLRRDGRIRPSSGAQPRANQQPDHLSVTVSIGVAEPSTRYRQPEQVIQAADQALYRAKNKGRNRVELASTAPLRLAESKRAKASRL